MKRISALLAGCVLLLFTGSCSAIEGIFKAGMGVGVFMVILVIVVIGVVVMKARKK